MPRKKPIADSSTINRTPSPTELRIMQMAEERTENDGESAVLSVRIPKVLKQRILKQSERTGRDVSDVVRPALGDAFGMKSLDLSAQVTPPSPLELSNETIRATLENRGATRCDSLDGVYGCWIGPVFWTLEYEKV